MRQYTILVCDDMEAVHESLSFFLEKEGMLVVSAYDGSEVLPLFHKNSIDLVVLDVMMPNMNGFEVCRTIRKESNVPIIFLSALGEEDDRVGGLERGADDYVTKPFSPKELTLRIKRLLVRTAQSHGQSAQEQENILTFEELTVSEDKMEVTVKGSRIDMTAREVSLLLYLIRNANRVLNRDQILNAVWGYDYYGDTRTVDAVIKRMRKKLPSEGVHFAIQSVYGAGYRLGSIKE
ncbi:MAG: response regulator transcription factor [Lachnospiraceae bacterium]|nr:response regulator transcription factor [Lachnospiraceae bacterium]